MKIILNGEAHEIQNNINLENLVKLFNIKKEAIVVEINREIINKKIDWATVLIKENDEIEFISFFGGG